MRYLRFAARTAIFAEPLPGGDWCRARIVVCVLYRVDSRVFLPYRCFRLMAAVSCTEFPLVQYGFARGQQLVTGSGAIRAPARADLSLSRTPDRHARVRVDVSLPAGDRRRQFFQQGVTTTANPHGSAFYVFMGIHGIHLIAGLCWLEYLYVRSRKLFLASENELRKYRAVASAAATYWHFMGVVWALLFFFLLRWSR